MFAVEKSLTVEKLFLRRRELECAAVVEMKQQMLAESEKESQRVSFQLAEGEKSLQGLQSMLAAVMVSINKWPGLPTEAAEELRIAHADVALTAALRESALKKLDTPATVTKTLQKQMSVKSSELLQMPAKLGDLSAELGRLRSQSAAEDAVFKNLKLVLESCECSTKRAKVSRWYESSPAILSTAEVLALLAEQEDFRNLCGVLSIKNQSFSRLAAEAK